MTKPKNKDVLGPTVITVPKDGPKVSEVSQYDKPQPFVAPGPAKKAEPIKESIDTSEIDKQLLSKMQSSDRVTRTIVDDADTALGRSIVETQVKRTTQLK